MDFPGHYQRLIRSVALSIPCVVGPYTSISCTLRLLDSEYRFDPTATDRASYPKSTDSDDPRFRVASTPISSIAVSTAQADSGVFEVNFHDERYMPFEGAGATTCPHPSDNGTTARSMTSSSTCATPRKTAVPSSALSPPRPSTTSSTPSST